jgi:hypothetical protein
VTIGTANGAVRELVIGPARPYVRAGVLGLCGEPCYGDRVRGDRRDPVSLGERLADRLLSAGAAYLVS